MEKIQNVLMKYLMPIANKLEQQKHIQAIKDGKVGYTIYEYESHGKKCYNITFVDK